MTPRQRTAAVLAELVAAHPAAPHGARWRRAVEAAAPVVAETLAGAGVRVLARERAGYLVHVLDLPCEQRRPLAAALAQMGGAGWRSPRPPRLPWGDWLAAQRERPDEVGDLARSAAGQPWSRDVASTIANVEDEAAISRALSEWGAAHFPGAAFAFADPDGIHVACPGCDSWHLHSDAADRSPLGVESRIAHCADNNAYSVLAVRPEPFHLSWRSRAGKVTKEGRAAIMAIATTEKEHD